MKEKIAVVGHTDLGRTCATHLREKGIGAVIIDAPGHHVERVIHHEPDLIAIAHNPNEFHINGIMYEPIPQPPKPRGYSGSRMMQMGLGLYAMGMLDFNAPMIGGGGSSY